MWKGGNEENLVKVPRRTMVRNTWMRVTQGIVTNFGGTNPQSGGFSLLGFLSLVAENEKQTKNSTRSYYWH